MTTALVILFLYSVCSPGLRMRVRGNLSYMPSRPHSTSIDVLACMG
jgi:hypothetical protein